MLDKKLEVQTTAIRNKDEALIHNLIFSQRADDSSISDLWILNEEFIYFRGNSDIPLKEVTVEGKKLFKTEFTEEENRYLTSLGENRLMKKPDVLLFPAEGKCIIIEFKAPDVNVSDHLTQIERYAYLIRNFTNDEFQIATFYGYLIGEDIEPRDVRASVSAYKHSYHFDYLFRPATDVIGEGGRQDGSIYTEVIKYSTLLERAKLRNKIFIDKLGLHKENN